MSGEMPEGHGAAVLAKARQAALVLAAVGSNPLRWYIGSFRGHLHAPEQLDIGLQRRGWRHFEVQHRDRSYRGDVAHTTAGPALEPAPISDRFE